MGNCMNCLNEEVLLQRTESINCSNIEDFYLIQPSLLPSDIGIKRKALKKSNQQEAYTVTSLYKKTSHELRMLEHESSIIKNLKHPNILQFESIFEDNVVYHLITEEISGITLLDLLLENHKLNELATRKIIKQILKAIQYLHGKGIFYGNLCVDTIKISNNQVKLINFTKARKANDDSNYVIGNYNFMAPECFAENYNDKSDMWSIGVITYYLLTGNLPFEGSEKVEIIANISRGRYQKNGLSESAKEFIAKLLVIDPEKRSSAEECLNNSWVMTVLEMN